VDTKGFVNEWNQKAEAITGYSRHETMGQNFVLKFIAPDWKKPVNEVRGLSSVLLSAQFSPPLCVPLRSFLPVTGAAERSEWQRDSESPPLTTHCYTPVVLTPSAVTCRVVLTRPTSS
jgi:PAS domain-containing protein